ncbi:MAG: PDZ domain-containing protein [Planctomycetes bacterium]|nr:PDZ domain-containing protein [Planctomycetota bacterium]
MKWWTLGWVLCASTSCSLFEEDLPKEAPALVDMEEPPAAQHEPDDEAARRALPLGSFTGAYVVASNPLGVLRGEVGVLIERIVENSPAHAAGLQEGDRLLEVHAPPTFDHLEVDAASTWGKIEREAVSGTPLDVLFDREGREREVTLVPVARVAPGPRQPVERLREEAHIGVVLRTATEVEAHAHGLGPGGGAVVTGLSQRSPWRAAGIQLGDLILAVDGRAITHPQVVLDGILEAVDRDAESMSVQYARGGHALTCESAISEREGEVRGFTVPLLFSYENKRKRSEWALLLGLLGNESTAVASRFRILWFITFESGDADLLEEVDR